MERIIFILDKYKLIHFSHRKADQDLSYILSIIAGPVTVSENITYPYLRQLGVLFNKKLSFKYYVREITLKALTVINALCSLRNIVQGIKPYLMRQAVIACMLWKAYFSIETQWLGYSRPCPCVGSILNQVQGQLNKIAKVIQTGARVILPIYYITPLPTLYQESGLLLAEIKLNHIATSAVIYVYHLDPYHPLRRRAVKIIQTSQVTSYFAC